MAGHGTAVFLLAAALCSASACYPRPQLRSNWPVPDSLANYRIGETLTARRGDLMIDRTEGAHVLQGYVLTREIGVVGTDRQPTMDSGIWAARFQYHGACPDGAYVVTNPYFYEERVGIVVSEDGSITCDMPVVQLVGGKTGRTWQLDEQLPVYGIFRSVPFVASLAPEALRWQLVYRGRSGKSVTLEYRELRESLDDNAQPTFEQTITHDLGGKRTLSFRGTEVQIVSATDREISFRVVKDEVPVESREAAPFDGGATQGGEYRGGPPGGDDPGEPPGRGNYGPY